MRTLPAGLAAQLTAANATFAHLLELEFSAGWTYLTDAGHDLLIGGQLYTAVGGAMVIGAARESTDRSAQGTPLQLSGVDQGIVSALLTNFYRGRKVRVLRVYFDAAGAVVGPWLVFERYQVQAWRARSTRDQQIGAPGTVTLDTTVVSLLALTGLRRGIRTNITSHQRYSPGDGFFQYVSNIAGKVIRFGDRTTIHDGGGTDDPGLYDPGQRHTP